MTPAQQKDQRFAYLDFLRILAAFLVIVNHTNSVVIRSLTPAVPTWWLSVAWYYVSKIAVPLFVMVSGACLLPRQDGYRRALGRLVRILIALVLFSYGYYLVQLWETYWTWQKALDIPAFLVAVWQGGLTNSLWYLYFYLGLMLMLPFLQKLAGAMGKRDIEVFMGISFTVYALWPLATHYVPALALPPYFDVPLFGVLIGLFFAGHYLHAYAGRVNPWLCALAAVLAVAASTGLTGLEAGRVTGDGNYLFMDSRTAPSIFVVLSAMAVMALARRAFDAHGALREKPARRLAALGGYSFGIYLVQELLIRQTRQRCFEPLCAVMDPLLAALVWEAGVFAIALGIVWAMKRIPLLKRIL